MGCPAFNLIVRFDRKDFILTDLTVQSNTFPSLRTSRIIPFLGEPCDFLSMGLWKYDHPDILAMDQNIKTSRLSTTLTLMSTVKVPGLTRQNTL